LVANPLNTASIAACFTPAPTDLSLTALPNTPPGESIQLAHGTDVVTVTKAVGDQIRADILKTLAQDSFGVQELVAIFNVAQPALSHHLKKLSEAGLVSRRREGTSVFYQRASARNAPLLDAIYQALDHEPLSEACREGIHRVHTSRVRQSQHFFDNQADALAKQTALICAPDVYVEAVLAAAMAEPALDRRRALEVGPGSGALLKALSPYFDEVTGVDNSAGMLANTQASVSELANVKLLDADVAQLSHRDHFNLVAAAMVLHHMPSPLGFFQQAANLLHERGVLVIAELCNHDQDWVKALCGDVWLGFEPDLLADWAAQAGFQQTQHLFLAQRNGFRVQVSAFVLISSNTQTRSSLTL